MKEVTSILMQRSVKVDHVARTDRNYPCGFMDVISIEKTDESFRLLYDARGKFAVHRISSDEAKYKLCKVRKTWLGAKGVPYLNTYDGRTIRYPDPVVKANDTIKFDLATGKIIDSLKFEVGNLAMIVGGHNIGRVGIIVKREQHIGAVEVIRLKDAQGHDFATRVNNVFVIGKESNAWISLPSGKGIRISYMEERERKLANNAAAEVSQ